MARVHRSIGVGRGHCRRFGFFFVLAAALAALLPWRLLGAWLRPERPSWLGVVFQRLLLRGLRIRVATRRAIDPGALVVANHISWTDILVLGSLRPMAFVAKSEVRGWPLLGMLARLHGTLFICRGDRGGVAGQVDRITAALERGPVVLFPEGTTGNGADVLPFRSTLFAAAAGRRVQPVTLRYRPRGRGWRAGELADFSWDGDKAFWPHLLAVAGGEPMECEVIFHPPLAADGDRKGLAQQCRAIVRMPLSQSAAG